MKRDHKPVAEAQTIMDALRSIVQTLRRASAGERNNSNLTSAQALLLRTLQLHEGASINDLAALTHTNQSTVSEVVSRLEAKGVIERRIAEDDRRRCELHTLAKGRDLLERHGRTPQEDMVRAISDMPHDDRSALARGLQALAGAVGARDGVPPLFFEEADSE